MAGFVFRSKWDCCFIRVFLKNRLFSCREEMCNWWLPSCVSLGTSLKSHVPVCSAVKWDNNHHYLVRLLGGLNELIYVKCMDPCLKHSQCSINSSYYYFYQYNYYLYYYNNCYYYYYWKATGRILEKKFQQWYLAIKSSLSILGLTTSGKITLLLCLPQLHQRSQTND